MRRSFNGVIEGFYGRPWSAAQRAELLGLLSTWDLDTYIYGPKDDIRLRAAWREPYGTTEARELAGLTATARRHGVAIHYAIAPGLDMRYGDAADRTALRDKVDQLLGLGFAGITLLFDDIPAQLPEGDRSAFASFAHAQADVANDLHAHLSSRGGVPLLLCPTEYCDRRARPSVAQSPYLRTLGEELHPDIDVFWTGPEIVSETITRADAERVAAVLRRPPLLWDNLHANDYDQRRLCLGPYSGRPHELKNAIRGVITNPNVEYEANFVPLHTLAAWLRSDGDDAGAAERRLDTAILDWAPRFATHDGGMTPEQIRLLVDYHHLPFAHGPGARDHLAAAATVVRARRDHPATETAAARELLQRQDARIQDMFRTLTTVLRRDLVYALYPYAWDLKEESDVLAAYARHASGRFCRPDALANTYRSGVIDAFQALLPLDDDGCVTP